MSEVSISYKGAEIAALNDSGTKRLLTSGKYCEGDISVAYTKPSGGGGATVIASGTYAGNGDYRINIPVGKKMPQTAFTFTIWLPKGSEFPYIDDANNNLMMFAHFTVPKNLSMYDLSQNVTAKTAKSILNYTVNNNGTITSLSPAGFYGEGSSLRGTSPTLTSMGTPAMTTVTRGSTGFTINMTRNAWQFHFRSGMVYNWELIYFGSDPTNDIVEVP